MLRHVEIKFLSSLLQRTKKNLCEQFICLVPFTLFILPSAPILFQPTKNVLSQQYNFRETVKWVKKLGQSQPISNLFWPCKCIFLQSRVTNFFPRGSPWGLMRTWRHSPNFYLLNVGMSVISGEILDSNKNCI